MSTDRVRYSSQEEMREGPRSYNKEQSAVIKQAVENRQPLPCDPLPIEHHWTEDHGPDKLYSKFDVYKPRDSDIVDAEGVECLYYPVHKKVGSDGEFIFVLRPERDEAALWALYEYAMSVEYRSPELAAQLREKLNEIEERECQDQS